MLNIGDIVVITKSYNDGTRYEGRLGEIIGIKPYNRSEVDIYPYYIRVLGEADTFVNRYFCQCTPVTSLLKELI